MTRSQKLREKLLRLPGEMLYSEVKQVLEGDGWKEDRIEGSHHNFTKPGRRTLPIKQEHGKVKRGYLRKIKSEMTDGSGE